MARNRVGLLERKACSIERGLVRWAKKNRILMHGESLRFRMHIETKAIEGCILGGEINPIEGMAILDFFTSERAERVGVDQRILTRIRHYLTGGSAWNSDEGKKFETIRDLLRHNRSGEYIRAYTFGNRTIEAVEKMLRTEFPKLHLERR